MSGHSKNSNNICVRGVVGGEDMEEEFGMKEKISGKKLIEKNEAIDKEEKKIRKMLKKVDKDKIKMVEKLIQNVAFMSVALDELKEDIKLYGVKEPYMNGSNQFGFKESIESKTYNTMLKNYMNAVKQLVELLPEKEKKNEGEALLKFIASDKK